ncbi:MAG: hypothetical protein Q8909_10635 [Bacteroidota bacterium]|nr:hypothetical protein [Bacteroidota bacterium]
MRNIIHIAICLLLFSCSGVKKDKQKALSENRVTEQTNKKSTATVYSRPVIIWVHPTQKELDSISSVLKNTDIEDDASYYNTEAQSFLLDHGHKYMISDSVTYYKFSLGKEIITIDKRSVENSPWTIILFNNIEKPIIVAPVNIEEAYRSYFEKVVRK